MGRTPGAAVTMADPGSPAPPPKTDCLAGLRRLGYRMSHPDGGAHRRIRGGRRRWPRRTLIGVNVVTALFVIASASGYGYVQWRLGQLKRVHIPGLHPQGHSAQSSSRGPAIAPFTLLVIGSDTRNLGSGGGAQFGSTSEVQGQRSDSIILVRAAPQTRSLALLSIPRDTLVPVPGYGTTRINTAFNSGTPGLLVRVLDQDFGIQVNHVVQFNFDTFRAVADAVGGVEQYFPTPARDQYSLLRIPSPGCYNLSDDQALAFVRSREYQYRIDGVWHYQLYPESDLARIQRQQAFVRALVKKARKVAPTDVIELNNIIGGLTKNLIVDSGFSDSLLLDLAKDYRGADLANIPSYTYPAVNSTAVPGALDPSTRQGDAVIEQWLNVGKEPPSKPSGATTPTTGVPPTTVVAPESLRIQVLDGSGAVGAGRRAGQDLTELGYQVAVSGRAASGLPTTVINYAPDSMAAAQQLRSQLAGRATLTRDDSLTPTPYNLQVVLGENFHGLAPGVSPRGASPSTGPTTSTTVPSPAYAGTATVDPASSSTYHGVYIPPGLEPGQTPRTCGE